MVAPFSAPLGILKENAISLAVVHLAVLEGRRSDLQTRIAMMSRTGQGPDLSADVVRESIDLDNELRDMEEAISGAKQRKTRDCDT